jgi:hypothetical protein
METKDSILNLKRSGVRQAARPDSGSSPEFSKDETFVPMPAAVRMTDHLLDAALLA